jgi:flagellar biosynthesis/type III secretory pathway protein FliH
MSSIPREVDGKWYPVPCPLEVRLGTNFATEAECAAFVGAWDILTDVWAEREEELVRKMQEDADANEWQSYDNGYDSGIEEGRNRGYDEGYQDGVKDTKNSLLKPA